MVQNVHYTPEMIGSEGVKVKADLDVFFILFFYNFLFYLKTWLFRR